jgi:hypothetical protein
VLALMCGGVGVARADEGSSLDATVFEWSAPRGCPQRADLLLSLATLARVDAGSWSRFDAIRCQVTGSDSEWALAIEFVVDGQRGLRSFRSRRCEDLGQAAVVALALALEPSWDGSAASTSAATPEEGAGMPDGNEEVLPASDDAVLPVAQQLARGQARTRVEAGLAGILDPTTLGASSFGVSLFAQARRGALSAGVYGAWLPLRPLDVRSDSEQYVELGLLLGGVRGCRYFGAALGLCAVFELGELAGNGSGLQTSVASQDWWLAPGLELALGSRLFASWQVDSRISVLLPLVRTEYVVDGAERVHQVPAVILRLALGLSVPVF